MAIYRPKSYDYDHDELPQVSGSTVTAEGQAVVSSINATTGLYGVKPSTGAAGEVFAGFTKTQTSAASFQQMYGLNVEEVVLPASGIFQLRRVPVTGTLSVYDVAGAALVSGATVTAGGLMTLAAAGSKSVVISYQFAMTVAESKMRYGDQQPGGYSGNYVGSVSVARRGVIYTDSFDASKNWRAATSVKLAANGLVTDQSGTGTAIQAEIISVPSATLPFLGLRYRA